MNRRPRIRRRPHPILALAITLVLATTACETSPTDGQVAGGATVAGWVDSSPSEAPAGASASTARGSGPAASGGLDARTVAIGRVGSAGAFHVLAEGEVEADGSFRIEGVPAGHVDLVVIAYAEGDAEVGSVVLHETTRAAEEHRTHPIDARSTLHARTFVQTEAGSGGGMSAAELALYVDVEAEAAARAAASTAEIASIASAALHGKAAFDAVLEAEGVVGLDAAARAGLLAMLVADRDRGRDAGGKARTSQEAFLAAAVEAYAAAGADPEAIALATAAAATAFDGALQAGGVGTARLDLARHAVLLNLAAGKRAAADVQGNPLGLKAVVAEALLDAEAAVRGAATIEELRAGLETARKSGKDRLVAAGLLSLDGLLGGSRSDLETELAAVLADAALWIGLEAAASAQGKAQAAAEFRAQVRVAVEALLEGLPSGARAGVSAEMLTALLVAFGAGPHCP